MASGKTKCVPIQCKIFWKTYVRDQILGAEILLLKLNGETEALPVHEYDTIENVKEVIREHWLKTNRGTNDIVFTGLAVQLEDGRTLSDYCAKTLMFVEVSPKSKYYWHDRLGRGSLSGTTQLCLVKNDFTMDATRNSTAVVAKTADVSFNFDYRPGVTRCSDLIEKVLDDFPSLFDSEEDSKQDSEGIVTGITKGVKEDAEEKTTLTTSTNNKKKIDPCQILVRYPKLTSLKNQSNFLCKWGSRFSKREIIAVPTSNDGTVELFERSRGESPMKDTDSYIMNSGTILEWWHLDHQIEINVFRKDIQYPIFIQSGPHKLTVMVNRFETIYGLKTWIKDTLNISVDQQILLYGEDMTLDDDSSSLMDIAARIKEKGQHAYMPLKRATLHLRLHALVDVVVNNITKSNKLNKQNKTRIKVRTLTGKDCFYDLDLSRGITISVLKAIIEVDQGIPSSIQRIVHAGRQCDDMQLLSDLNLGKDADGTVMLMFILIFRLRGGMFHQTSSREDFLELFRHIEPEVLTVRCGPEESDCMKYALAVEETANDFHRRIVEDVKDLFEEQELEKELHRLRRELQMKYVRNLFQNEL
jgi:hypothetical protein